MAFITVTGFILDPNGTVPTSGTLTAQLSGYMIDSDDNIIVAKQESVAVTAGTGAFSIILESTLDCTPNTRTYSFQFSGVIEGVSVTQDFGSFALAPTPASVTLADLIQAGIVEAVAVYPLISGADVFFTLKETDQALPLGLWRTRISGDVLGLEKNTAAAGDFSTLTELYNFTGSLFTLKVPLGAGSDNSQDIGVVATRWRTGYFGTRVVSGVATNATGSLYTGSDTASTLVMDSASATDTNASAISFDRARGTQGARANVVSGDHIGTITAVAWSGATGYWSTAAIKFLVDGTVTDNQRPPARMDVYTNVANTSPTLKWSFTSVGDLDPGGDNVYDFGDPALRIRTLHAGTALAIGTNPATTGPVRLPNDNGIVSRNAANSANHTILFMNSSDQVVISSTGQDIKWGVGLVALGGGAAPTLGTIGGSGPATAAQNAWMRVIDSTGAAFWVPAWK